MIMIQKNNKESYTLWQSNEDGVPEPAILFNLYTGVFEMNVDGVEIIINYDSINDLIKVLKLIQKNDI